MLIHILLQVQPSKLSNLWKSIDWRTNQLRFERYKDLSLVLVFDHLAVTHGGIDVGLTTSDTAEESMNRALKLWKMSVDMNYVPKGNMECRLQSLYRV